MIKPLLFALSLASAQSSTETFVNLLRYPWDSLDPAWLADTTSFSIASNVYEPLVVFKSTAGFDEFAPFLSEEVPTVGNGLLSKDGRVYRFPIRKGVRFHDGSEMTAEDVRYSLLRELVMDREGGVSGQLLEPILGIYSTRDEKGGLVLDFKQASEAVRVEDGALVVALKRPFAPFLKLLASWPFVTSKAWAASHGEWDGREETWKAFNDVPRDKSYLSEHANGTGPFYVESVDRRERVVLARHDAYWRGPAKLDAVVFRVVPQDAMRILMLQFGDGDYAYMERPGLGYLQGAPGVKVLEGPANLESGETVFLGSQVEAFRDRDVRMALAHAFDYDKFLETAFERKGERAAGPIAPALLSGGPKPRYAFDLKKAERLLRKAQGGKVWSEGFRVPVAYIAGSLRKQVAAELLKENVEKLHDKFKLDLRPMPVADFFDALRSRSLPMFVLGFDPDYPDAHSAALNFFHSRGLFPQAQGFKSDELDRLVEQAAAEPDPEKRRGIYRKLVELAQEDCRQIYTVRHERFKAVRAELQGLDKDQQVAGLGYMNLLYFHPISK